MGDYGQIAGELSPMAVSQYLAATGWELESRNEIREIWGKATGADRAPKRLMLPIDTEFVDFEDRFRDLLHALGRIHDWDADQLHDKIVATHADLLFVKFTQENKDGSISFRHAVSTVNALYEVLKATATHVAEEGGGDFDEVSANVARYLDDDLRLGHTKRGGFVLTVMSRLDTGSGEGEREAPCFARRVMETVSIGFGAAVDAIDVEDDTESSQGQLSRVTLGGDVLSFLEAVATPDSVHELDLSFGWAAAGPPVRTQRDRIVVDRVLMRKLPAARRKLEKSRTANPKEAFVGTVHSLTSDQRPGEASAGTIELATRIKNEPRIVVVPFHEEQREVVIEAYRNNTPLLAVGDLVIEAGTRRLTGNVRIAPEPEGGSHGE